MKIFIFFEYKLANIYIIYLVYIHNSLIEIHLIKIYNILELFLLNNNEKKIYLICTLLKLFARFLSLCAFSKTPKKNKSSSSSFSFSFVLL